MSTNGSAFRWWKGALRALVVPSLFAGVLVGLPWLGYRWLFPYGQSHCCDLALQGFLHQYAEEHGGKFPAGEATPEASLSLLHYANLSDTQPFLLGGKTVPESVVQKIFNQGGLLSPDTCGWHYVEGLTVTDDERLALFWDKAGLGHLGQRHSSGQFVCFVQDMKRAWILDEDWEAFLEEQRRLLAARKTALEQATPGLSAKVRLPSGEDIDAYLAAWSLTCERRGEGHHVGPERVHLSHLECRHSSGERLGPTMLQWRPYGLPGDTHTYTLTLGEWRSEPVTIKVVDAVATPSEFVFVMSPAEVRKDGAMPPEPETASGDPTKAENRELLPR